MRSIAMCRKSILFAICFAFITNSSFAARLVAHWKLNETSPPYADDSGNSTALTLDPATAVPIAGTGVDGAAAHLRWNNPPGVSTRLCAYHGVLQNDSFGFSIWINPQFLSPSDNLMAKEMPANNSGPAYTRLAW